MSYQNFEKAIELDKQCKFYWTVEGESEEIIRKSEILLDIKFLRQHHSFYDKLGHLSFYRNKLYGIDPNYLFGILEGNSIAYALHDR